MFTHIHPRPLLLPPPFPPPPSLSHIINKQTFDLVSNSLDMKRLIVKRPNPKP